MSTVVKSKKGAIIFIYHSKGRAKGRVYIIRYPVMRISLWGYVIRIFMDKYEMEIKGDALKINYEIVYRKIIQLILFKKNLERTNYYSTLECEINYDRNDNRMNQEKLKNV